MHALVQQFATAGTRSIGAPFALVAETAAVAVARPYHHHRAVALFRDELARSQHRGVEPMVEADSHRHTGARSSASNGFEFGAASRAGLLDEHVAAALDR